MVHFDFGEDVELETKLHTWWRAGIPERQDLFYALTDRIHECEVDDAFQKIESVEDTLDMNGWNAVFELMDSGATWETAVKALSV